MQSVANESAIQFESALMSTRIVTGLPVRTCLKSLCVQSQVMVQHCLHGAEQTSNVCITMETPAPGELMLIHMDLASLKFAITCVKIDRLKKFLDELAAP